MQTLAAAFEAKVKKDRGFAGKAVTGVVHPDSGCGAHLVRFSFGCVDVTSHRGILGQVRMRDLDTKLQGGDKLSLALVATIREFCTEGFGVPAGAKKTPHVNKGLLRKLQKTIVVYDPDGAQDATSAGLSLERKRFGTNVDIRARLRDHTHASRRVLTRPSAADNYSQRVAQRWIFGKGSPAQLMEHSSAFRDLVAEEISRSDQPTLTLVNMSAKKHRYEKCSTPMAKATVWSLCLLMAAVRGVLCKIGTPTMQAQLQAFLAEVDTEEVYSLGALAEEGDDGLQLVRFFDTEEMDPACMSSELELFRQKVEVLYINGGALEQGFCKLLQNLYEEPLLIPSAASGVPDKLVGGRMDAAMKDRILSRMQCWGAMSLSVVLAEFPKWEILQSSSIFILGTSSGHRAHGDDGNQSGAFALRLRRLAKFCGRDAKPFEEQFEDLRPLAQWHKNNGPNHPNVECWRLAKEELDAARQRNRNGFRAKHPVADIEQGLAT